MQKHPWRLYTQTGTYLLDSVLVHSLLFVQACKSTIVTLVQSPVLRHGNPQLVRLFKSQEQRFDGTFQARRIRSVEFKSFHLDELSAIPRFLNTYS